MIISSPGDYREAARRKLPPFLFHYIDGGAYAEQTLRRNVEDWQAIALRQRVLQDMTSLSLETRLFDETLRLPIILAPVGLTGMYARRGEVQAAKAAASRGVPFTLSPSRSTRSRRWRPRSTGPCGSSFMCCATGAS